MAADRRLMVIFSVGGPGLVPHRSSRVLRCQPSVVTLADPPELVLDPFPAAGSTGVVADGRVRVLRDGTEVEAGPIGAPLGRLRWDVLDILAFAGSTLTSWIVLPAMLGHPSLPARDLGPAGAGLRRIEVRPPPTWPGSAPDPHVLHVDADGLVRRHEQGPFLHELGGHCDFGGAMVATRRRTRSRSPTRTRTGSGRAGTWLPFMWADVVAAHAIPDRPGKTPLESLMEGPDLPTPLG